MFVQKKSHVADCWRKINEARKDSWFKFFEIWSETIWKEISFV